MSSFIDAEPLLVLISPARSQQVTDLTDILQVNQILLLERPIETSEVGQTAKSFIFMLQMMKNLHKI